MLGNPPFNFDMLNQISSDETMVNQPNETNAQISPIYRLFPPTYK